MIKRQVLKLLVVSFLIAFLLPNLAFAREFEVEWPEIPGTEFVKGQRCPAKGCPPENFADFVVYLFNLALVIAGFVTFVMIIIAGVQYLLLAVESPLAAQTALRRIKNALLGLILLFGGFLILNAIDPELLVPGLEMTKIQETPLGDLDIFDRECKDGVLICSDKDCKGRCLCIHDDIPNLQKYNFNDKARSFKINASERIVVFFEHANYRGVLGLPLGLSVEGPSQCTNFEEVGFPNLDRKVSSVGFLSPETTLCSERTPSNETCEIFSFTNTTPTEKRLKYGKIGKEFRVSVTNNYNFTTGTWKVGNDNAEFVGVPAGKIVILCYDPPDPADKCFFFLESTPLIYYGEISSGALTGNRIDNDVSYMKIIPTIDVYHQQNPDVPICKGAIFFSEKEYNREKASAGLWEGVAAAMPLGLGIVDDTSTWIDLTGDPSDPVHGPKNFTRINDLKTSNFEEFNTYPGDALHISSIKIIGNCKLKICKGANLSGDCTF